MKKKLSAIIVTLVALSLCAALLCIGTAAETNKTYTIVERGNYLYGVPENWTVAALKRAYTGKTYSIFNADNEPMQDKELVGTGCKMRYETGVGEIKIVTIVVRGDTSGDGKVTSTDYLKIKAYLRGNGTLVGEYKLAADIDGNGTISSVDYINVKAYFFGTYDIYSQSPVVPDESDDSSPVPDSDESWTSG